MQEKDQIISSEDEKSQRVDFAFSLEGMSIDQLSKRECVEFGAEIGALYTCLGLKGDYLGTIHVDNLDRVKQLVCNNPEYVIVSEQIVNDDLIMLHITRVGLANDSN